MGRRTSGAVKLLVTGAAGLLGTAVVACAQGRRHHVVALSSRELDVTVAEDVRRVLAQERPDWVAHCAAYTAVDRAERESERAYAVNGDAAGSTAGAAATVGSRFLLLSTDFVFGGDGTRPYRPDAEVGPRSVYGRSKLRGEELTRTSGARHLIVRTSWLYGSGGSNFVDMVISKSIEGTPLRIVSDQVGRPTWTGSLADALMDLMESNAEGITHVADTGTATWFELAGEATRLAGVRSELSPVTTAEWGAPAARPAYSVLALDDVEDRLGRRMPVWRESLRRHVATRWPAARRDDP